MNTLLEALEFLVDPANLTGPRGIFTLLLNHLTTTATAVLVAAAIGIPLGLLIGHTGRGRNAAVSVAGALRALPSLGLFIFLVLQLGAILGTVQAASVAQLIALVVLAVPSILAGTYAGLEAIDRRTVDAARAVGMTEWQILGRVEIPLGLPLIVGGLRTAVLQVVATATIGAYAINTNLGSLIFTGLPTRRFEMVLAGALLITVLALVLEGVFALLQRLAQPRGVLARPANDRRTVRAQPASSTRAAEQPSPAPSPTSP